MSNVSFNRCRGTFTCKYLSFYDPKLQRKFRLPLVHVRLKHNGNTIRTDALVDSGATTTFIPIELAEVLDMKIPSEFHDAIGAGGAFPIYESEIEVIEILKGSHVFCQMQNFPVSVPKNPDALPHTILGRDSVFWKNDITFRERRQHTIFREPKPPKRKRGTNYC
jgi:hypothetical protein